MTLDANTAAIAVGTRSRDGRYFVAAVADERRRHSNHLLLLRLRLPRLYYYRHDDDDAMSSRQKLAWRWRKREEIPPPNSPQRSSRMIHSSSAPCGNTTGPCIPTYNHEEVVVRSKVRVVERSSSRSDANDGRCGGHVQAHVRNTTRQYYSH